MTATGATAPRAQATRARPRNADKTKAKILHAATREFGGHGFSGARIERIARAAKCNIRLLYHYFGNKKALYLAVLEGAYSDLRQHQATLDFDLDHPLDAIEKLLRFNYAYFEKNPYFEGLLRAENMMRGKFVSQSDSVPRDAAILREKIEVVLQRGIETGEIRPDVDVVQLYVTITALARFHLSNSYSLSAMLGTDLRSAEWREQRLEHAVELLRGWLVTGAEVKVEEAA